ncbi:ABC transporter permease [Oceanibacterium hippocampi]|uniref:Putative aliphatic sulfonates transport permease protein SsuC n=1 Tax=Oceanibacterium hippocampi TaxID=745714 RepID=A0A1Y5T783_9PROT|nr:ABC transporter permease [Oceanibacterium hippocampi]SLN57426.1 Putative aliphatic sulfonates transport permease protein SsuC [Oceanibacterium hippocampi]
MSRGNAVPIDLPVAGALLLGLVAFALPAGHGDAAAGETVRHWWTGGWPLFAIALLIATAAGWLVADRRGLAGGPASGLALAAVTIAAAIGGLDIVMQAPGTAGWGLWIFVGALGLSAWRAMEVLTRDGTESGIYALIVPTLFGLWLLYLWEIVVQGFGIPRVLLPAPSQIAQVFVANTDTLRADFYQTVMKSVLSGFAFGCGSGFLIAVLVDRVPFLQRGLLPLGSLVSAIPIIGIAPIMVMWFGFDWQSKAAVIVVMTFFPMLINTLAGLNAAGSMERDLMRSYAAGYWQTLLFLRLPNAMPFIFNALKINSTLALIGAIVAEFFGTPIVGMGFRISTEVGRMNIDMVWATIAVAAIFGSMFYGGLALLERAVTSWHPSYRR